MTIIPRFEFNKYDFGLGIVFRRENESKKYNRKYKTINEIEAFASKMMDEIREEEREVAEKSGYIFPEE